jgi:hypothetical protein
MERKMTQKGLPMGDLPFTEVIDENFIYADKTQYIYKLIKRKNKNY